MKVTINWTDHRYSTHEFKEVPALPEVGAVIEQKGWIFTVTAIQDLTSMAARSDFGDGGYMQLARVYFDDQELMEDVDDVTGESFSYYEPAGEHHEYYAVWHSYEED